MTVTLSEAESRRLVARHGVPVSPFVTAGSATAAVEAVATSPEVTFPVVAKLCGRRIAHKTERGLVKLRLGDSDALRAAADELLRAATTADGPVELLVSSMLPGSRELIAGVTRHEQFGPVAMLGVGGVLAEAIRAVVFRLVPMARVDAEELVDDLAPRRLLGELRGEPPVDRDALIGIVGALATAIMEEPRIAGIDLNPLLVVDGRPIAVDALVVVEDPEMIDS